MINERLSQWDFEFLVDKIYHGLNSWKRNILSKANKVTLAMSILAWIATYYIQLLRLPKTVYDLIDKSTRNFMWKGSSKKGIHLVRWDKITKPKKDGGLDICMATESNITMLGKLI